MNTIKKGLMFLTIFIIMPLTVNADCQSEFDAVANQFTAKYTYNKDTDDFTVTLTTPDYEKYYFQIEKKEDIDNTTPSSTGKKFISVTSNIKRSTFTYGILMNYGSCRGYLAKKETLQLKKYNPHADDALCQGNEEFALCRKDYEGEIDDETFKSRIETYIKSKEEETDGNSENSNNANANNNTNNNDDINNNDNIEKKNSFLTKIIDYINQNTTQVIIIAAFVLVLIISAVVYTVNSIKSRRLE